MNTNQTPQTHADKAVQRRRPKSVFTNRLVQFMLSLIAQIIELAFPGLLNGMALTPDILSALIRSFINPA